MTIYEMTEEEREKLREVPLEDLELSVRAYNALKRTGFSNLKELAGITSDELKHVRNLGRKQAEEILEKLAQREIFLLSDRDKKVLLKLGDSDVMQCEVQLLRERLERKEEELKRSKQYARELYEKYENKRAEERTTALEESKNLIADSEYPIESVVQRMYFGKSAAEGCGLCKIFGLWEKGCLLEEDASAGRSMDYSCELCIRNFLKDYYK